MYIILKHYKNIDSYNVERTIANEVDAIAFTDILNRNNNDAGIEYVISKLI